MPNSTVAIALQNASAAKRLPVQRRLTFQGIPISIENPKGLIRRGIDDEGRPWSNKMAAHYGYIKHTEDTDGGGGGAVDADGGGLISDQTTASSAAEVGWMMPP